VDWLLERQSAIEQRLARRHLKQGELALYDVSCSYFEGRACPLARFGYDHGNGKRGRMQVEYGLLCDSDGRPVAINAFEGSLKDAKTLPSQVEKIERRFGLERVIVATDRGIGTKENVTLLSQTAQFAFITALKAPQVRALVKEGCLQLSVFDELNRRPIMDCGRPLVSGGCAFKGGNETRHCRVASEPIPLPQVREMLLLTRRPLLTGCLLRLLIATRDLLLELVDRRLRRRSSRARGVWLNHMNALVPPAPWRIGHGRVREQDTRRWS